MKNNIVYVQKNKYDKYHIVRHTRGIHPKIIARALCGIDAQYITPAYYTPMRTDVCNNCLRINYKS